MRLTLGFVVAALVCVPAWGEDVPFAISPELQPGSNNAYLPGLSEIMQGIQLHDVKLWQAGSAADWPLAAFEAGEIQETMVKAAMFYDHIPVTYVAAMDRPLRDMQQAVKTHDAMKFDALYGMLTESCNSCHQAAGVGFIVIKTPSATPAVSEAQRTYNWSAPRGDIFLFEVCGAA